ncbi:MAG: GrpB family protein [Methanobacteriota archaeon]
MDAKTDCADQKANLTRRVKEVKLLDYDPTAPGKFNDIKSFLCSIIPFPIEVEHIGSTSVVGLGGKGVIDLLIIAKKESMMSIVEALETNGYQFNPKPGFGVFPERYFISGPFQYKGESLHVHYHITFHGSGEHIDHVQFRDYLRKHQDEADRYFALKKKWAMEANLETGIYTELKTPYVAEVLKKARGSMSSEDYWQSIEDFCDLCEENIHDQFVSFIVIGSVGANDFIPGWSDVDAFLIVKEASSDLAQQIDSMIKTIVIKYPYYQTDRGPWFCPMTTTKSNFVNPVEMTNPLNLWDVRHYGRFIRGEDFKDEIKLPELDKSWPDENTAWMLDFLKRDKDASPFWQLRNSIGFTLCGARNTLLKNGIYLKKYGEIVSAFYHRYPEGHTIVREVHDYRRNWSEWRNKSVEVARIYREALDFLAWCRTTR